MKSNADQVIRFADMFSALGTEARLRIMQLLLSAHPDGMVAGEIQSELGIPASTLSHHLDKLKGEGLVQVRRESTFLWYTASTEALRELLGFLYAECCTRNKAIHPELFGAQGAQATGGKALEEVFSTVALRVPSSGCVVAGCDCEPGETKA